MSKSKIKEQKIEVGKCYDNYGNNYQLNYGKYHVIVFYSTGNISEEFTFEHTKRKEPDGLDYIALDHENYGTFEHNAGYVLAYKGSLEMEDILSIVRHQIMNTHSETIDEIKYRINQVACNHILKGNIPFSIVDFRDDNVKIEKLK